MRDSYEKLRDELFEDLQHSGDDIRDRIYQEEIIDRLIAKEDDLDLKQIAMTLLAISDYDQWKEESERIELALNLYKKIDNV